MSDALALASAAATAGTTTLVATPHIDHQWHVRPELIPRLAAALRAEMRNEGIELELRTSGEVALSRVHELGLNPESALVRRSTLEDVFLRLTGRTLVD